MGEKLECIRKKWEKEARKDPFWITAGYAGRCPSDFEEDSNYVVEKEIIRDIDSEMLSNMTVLDIGCGVGRLMGPLVSRCHRVIGVDMSPTMIKLSKERLAYAKNVEFYVTSGSDLSCLSSESVDLVFSYAVLQHNSATVVYGYLKEVFRILKPFGMIRFQIIEHGHLFGLCIRRLLSGNLKCAAGHFLHMFVRGDNSVVVFPNGPLGKTYRKSELEIKLTEIGFSDVTFRDCDRMRGGIWVTCRKGSTSLV